MPELPEVEVVRAGLAEHTSNFLIEDAAIRHPRTARHTVGGPQALERSLRGRAILGWAVRGKYLWALLDDDTALVVHLGMSGQMLVRPSDAPPSKHERATLTSGGRSLGFVDQRTFGYLRADQLVGDRAGVPAGRGDADGRLPACVSHVGRDVLDPHLDMASVCRQVQSSARAVKAILLDQTVVSGVGNIYADEALWAAQVHPLRRGNELSKPKIEQIYGACRLVMERALTQGGTSFDSLYVNVNGESGYFSRSLSAYGRVGRPCERCGTPMRKVVVAGRSSTVCVKCQKVPRGSLAAHKG